MSKLRVLLVTAYAHRDMGTCYVLASLLKQKGYDCMIVSNGGAHSLHVRKWRPSAVFWMRMTNLKKGLKLYTNSYHYYCPGEGGEQYQFAEEKNLAVDKDLFSNIKRVFLWGNNSVDNILKKVEELGKESHLYNKKQWMENKVHIVGHPRMDIARFVNNAENTVDKIRIGFVGSFSVINQASKQSLLSKVLNSSNGYTHGIFQLNLANTYSRLMSELDQSKYRFSLRPYPGESRSEYDSMKKVKDGILSIDKHFDFATWISEQDLLIAPTSSTIPQIVMGRKPFILVDFIDNEPEQSVYRISLSKMFHHHMPKNVPKSFGELKQLINKYNELPFTTDGMNKLLEYVYLMSPDNSARSNLPSTLMLMASCIDSDLKMCANRKFSIFVWPGWLIRVIDRFKKVDANSYNDFRMSDFNNNLSDEFEQVVMNMLAVNK